MKSTHCCAKRTQCYMVIICQLHLINLEEDKFYAKFQKILVCWGSGDTGRGWTTCHLAFPVRVLHFHCDGTHWKYWFELSSELCTLPTSGDLTPWEQAVWFFVPSGIGLGLSYTVRPSACWNPFPNNFRSFFSLRGQPQFRVSATASGSVSQVHPNCV